MDFEDNSWGISFENAIDNHITYIEHLNVHLSSHFSPRQGSNDNFSKLLNRIVPPAYMLGCEEF